MNSRSKPAVRAAIPFGWDSHPYRNVGYWLLALPALVLAGFWIPYLSQAPAPSRPIVRGLAGAGFLAHVLVSKYADHLPLYRRSQI